jgi:hypothetical protein
MGDEGIVTVYGVAKCTADAADDGRAEKEWLGLCQKAGRSYSMMRRLTKQHDHLQRKRHPPPILRHPRFVQLYSPRRWLIPSSSSLHARPLPPPHPLVLQHGGHLRHLSSPCYHKRLALFPCARQVTSTRPRLGVVFRYSVLDILRVLFEEKLTERNASSTPSREVICSLTRHVSP